MARDARWGHRAPTRLLGLLLMATVALAGCQGTQETGGAAADPTPTAPTVGEPAPVVAVNEIEEASGGGLPWSTSASLGDVALRIAFTRPPDASGACTVWVNATMRIDSYKPQVWSALLVGGSGSTGGGTNENVIHARAWDEIDTRDDDNRDGTWIAWTSTRVAAALPRFDVILAAHGVMPLGEGATLAGGQGDPAKALELDATCEGAFEATVEVASSIYLFTEHSLSGGVGAGALGPAVSVEDAYAATYDNVTVYLQRPVHQIEADRVKAVGALRITGPHGQWVWNPSLAEHFVTRYDGGPGTYELVSDLVTTDGIWGLMGQFVPVRSVAALEAVFSTSASAGA